MAKAKPEITFHESISDEMKRANQTPTQKWWKRNSDNICTAATMGCACFTLPVVVGLIAGPVAAILTASGQAVNFALGCSMGLPSTDKKVSHKGEEVPLLAHPTSALQQASLAPQLPAEIVRK